MGANILPLTPYRACVDLPKRAMSVLDQCSNVEGMSSKNLYIYPVNTAFGARLDEEPLVKSKKDLGARTYHCESARCSSASNLLFVAERIRM
jgi:hypothetical protein